MQPIKQTILHDPDNGQYGNCFQACIASLLEMPITQVPHFYEHGENGSEALSKLNTWLALHGMGFFDISGNIGDIFKNNANTYHIISDYSPRNNFHTVIGLNGEMVFDPHPSNDGITKTVYRVYGFLYFTSFGTIR